MKFIDENIQEYCNNHLADDSPILKKLIKYTKENVEGSAMLSGKMVGSLLQGIICMLQVKHILEIGMYTGYSALKMAEVLPNDGKIDTCELGANHCKTARTFFNQCSDGKKITIHQGNAITTLSQFSNFSFDMVFIDADKINYLNYYQKSMNLIRSGGVIILDNMLWSGMVLNPTDEHSLALRKTGDYIQSDNRCYNFLLPIRDGLMICIKHWMY